MMPILLGAHSSRIEFRSPPDTTSLAMTERIATAVLEMWWGEAFK
jgi:hypothetical protein